MKIKECRVCGNKNLTQIGSLGNVAISDFTTTPEEGTKYPLTLVYCAECTLLQLDTNTPRDLLYKDYWYESHINPIIVDNLKEIGELCEGNIHVDIGSNDNTLLKYSKAKKKIGVDPCNVKSVYGIDLKVQAYWEGTETEGPVALSERGKIDVITAIACIYDLPDPNKFIGNVKRHLAPNGTFIAQLMTLSPMVENDDIGNVCHEHLEYYSYTSLVVLFQKNGLEIYKVERNEINGGSWRIFARHLNKGSIDYEESEHNINDLKEFFRRVEQNKKDFLEWYSEMPSTVGLYGYGASTKANTILQYYGIKHLTVVDINPLKKGKWMRNDCNIIDYIPEDADYLWVFPYGFIDYFKNKEKDYTGKWVTTIPKFQVL